MFKALFRHCSCRDLSEADASARVLVVDDEPMIVDAVAATLQLDGFRNVHGHTDARAALAQAEAEPIDLVISDLCLPDLEGAELLEAIAARFPFAPRVVLTGRTEPALVERAVRMGRPFALLEKPWCNRALSAEVCRALAWRRDLARVRNADERSARMEADLGRIATALLRSYA